MDDAAGLSPISSDARRARSSLSRHRITAALLELLEEGNPQPSVDAVAERAGVSRRTVFNRFRSMQRVLSELQEQQVRAVQKQLPDTDLRGTLRARVARYSVPYAELLEAVAPVRFASLVYPGTRAERAQIQRGVRRVQALLSSGPIELLQRAGVDVTRVASLSAALEAFVDPLTFRTLRVQHAMSHTAARSALAAGIVAIAESARTSSTARMLRPRSRTKSSRRSRS